MIRIAIADDEPLERELLSRALRRLELEIHEAASGAELLDLLTNEGAFDLVVTDVSMPRMTGVQVLVAARGAGLETPFLVLTAFPDAQLKSQVEAFANTRFLTKPIDVLSLRASVEALLGTSGDGRAT